MDAGNFPAGVVRRINRASYAEESLARACPLQSQDGIAPSENRLRARHTHRQSAFVGIIGEGHFNDTPLSGLN
jgi:hypothetical protein